MRLNTIYFLAANPARHVMYIQKKIESCIVHSYFSISLRFWLFRRFLVRQVSNLSVVSKLAETFREIQCLYLEVDSRQLENSENFYVLFDFYTNAIFHDMLSITFEAAEKVKQVWF